MTLFQYRLIERDTVPGPISVPETRFRRFRFRLRFLVKRFRRFWFLVPVRFMGHPGKAENNRWRAYCYGPNCARCQLKVYTPLLCQQQQWANGRFGEDANALILHLARNRVRAAALAGQARYQTAHCEHYKRFGQSSLARSSDSRRQFCVTVAAGPLTLHQQSHLTPLLP